MVINGYDYKFLYSISAFLALQGAGLPEPKTVTDRIKTVYTMAVLLNKAYEDAQQILNPRHEVNYLEPGLIKTLTLVQFDQLTAEVNEAVRVGKERTVEAEPIKKKKAKR